MANTGKHFTLSTIVLIVIVHLAEHYTEGCLVTKSLELTDTANTSLLSFINLKESLRFMVKFQDHELAYWLDIMILNNSKIEHFRIRDGKSNKTTHDLPLVVPEGWNKLRLEASNTNFILTRLFGDNNENEALLLDLQLDFSVSVVYIEGTFSLCSGDSPEWDVDEGTELSVPLQPEMDQQLQVTTQGKAAPYLKVPSTEKEQPTDINANTTLTVVTRQRRNTVQLVIKDDQETLVDVMQPAAYPTVLMGCHKGTLHLRLTLSTSTITNTNNDNSHSADTLNYWYLWLGGCALFLAGVMSGCLALFFFVHLCKRKRNAAASGESRPPRYHQDYLPVDTSSSKTHPEHHQEDNHNNHDCESGLPRRKASFSLPLVDEWRRPGESQEGWGQEAVFLGRVMGQSDSDEHRSSAELGVCPQL